MKVHIQLTNGLAPPKTRSAYLAGNAPDPIAYGFHHAEEVCESVSYSIDHPEGAIVSRFRDLLFRVLRFDLVHAWRNRQLIDAADVIWTIRESEYLAIIALRLLRPMARRVPVIATTIWLFDASQERRLGWRFRVWLAGKAEVSLVHSKEYLPRMRELMPKSLVALNYFGISEDTFKPSTDVLSQPKQIHVVAAGNDKTRDWATLFEAFGGDDRFQVSVACSWVPEHYGTRYRNVHIHRHLKFSELVNLYKSASFIVIPMVPNLYSGITVALESASLGKPIVSSQTGSVPTYFNADEVMFVAPCDPAQLRDRVLTADLNTAQGFANRAQLRFRRSGYTTRQMIGRYVDHSVALLAKLANGRT